MVDQNDKTPRHSGAGISAFVLGIVNLVLAVIAITAAGYFEAVTEGGMSEESPEAIIIGFLVISVGLLSLLGAGFGIEGIVQKNRRRRLTVLGLVFNVTALVIILVPLVIGLTIA